MLAAVPVVLTSLAAGATAPASPVGRGHAHAGRAPGSASREVRPATVPGGYSVAGTDVADVNGNIDWSGVASSPDVRFAYVKAAEGLDFIDPSYTNNVHDAKAQGLLVGAYDFARPDQGSPVKQADIFADTIKYSAADGQTLPPFVDLEYGTTVGVDNCYYDSPSELVSFIHDYLTELTKRIGRKPMIYTGVGWWEPCTGSSTAFGSYPLDVSDYDGSSPELPSGWDDFTFWQYADDEDFGGGQSLDGDVFNGTYSDLRAFATAQGTSSPSVAVQPSNGQLAASFRAEDTGRLWTWNGASVSGGSGTSTALGIAPGTSPAIAVLKDGTLAVAFHANDGHLWTWTGPLNSAGHGMATVYGMADHASPSIVALPNGQIAVAFAAYSTNKLWTWTGTSGTAGNAVATGYGIEAGTNPSVGLLSTGKLAVAFEANSTRLLWTWTGTAATAGTALATKYGIQAASSPSIGILPSGKLAVAFEANSTRLLWTWTGTVATAGSAVATKDGISANSSPSLAVLKNGQVAVAFNANSTGKLYTWSGAPATAGQGAGTVYGMAAGSSPSLVLRPNSYLAVAFKANSTNKLWTWTGAVGTTGTAAATKYGIS